MSKNDLQIHQLVTERLSKVSMGTGLSNARRNAKTPARARTKMKLSKESVTQMPDLDKSRVYYGGRIIDQNDTYKISTMKGLQETQQLSSDQSYATLSGPDASLELLKRLDCDICTDMGKDFSLLDTQTDREIIDNPNIMVEQRGTRKGAKQVATTDKFPSQEDPFYEVDRNIPDKQNLEKQQQDYNQKGQQSERIVKDLVRLNTAFKAQGLADYQLKQFNK